jgi:hypothetical protein
VIALTEEDADWCEECMRKSKAIVRFDIGDYPYDFDVCADCLKKALAMLVNPREEKET